MSAMGQLAIELRAKNLQPSRAGLGLFMDEALQQYRVRINEYISLYTLQE